MVSTVACVAVRHSHEYPTEIVVVYDSEYHVFWDPSNFTLYPHHELIAVDKNAFVFLKSRNLSSWIINQKSFLKYPCWECKSRKCLITIAFLAWRTCLKKLSGVPLKHGMNAVVLQSPRTQELFVAVQFDENDVPTNGCVVADSGYLDGDPKEWFPAITNLGIVLTAIGSKTGAWLKRQLGSETNYPMKIIHDIDLKYACTECNEKSCPLVKAFYVWKRLACQTYYIKHHSSSDYDVYSNPFVR